MHEADHGHTICQLPTEASVEAMLSSHPSTHTAIVFVHGFGGHAVSTWAQFQRLVDEVALDDAWWRHADLYFYGYPSVRQTANQSAGDLLRFLSRVYPTPPDAFFRSSVAERKARIAFGAGDLDAIRAGPQRYDALVLVGHSEGGVVLRLAIRELARRYDKAQAQSSPVVVASAQALLDRARAESWSAERWAIEVSAIAGTSPPQPPSPLLAAALRLFAPAISGAAPSGIAGFLYNSFIGAAVRPFLGGSSAFNDLQPGSAVLAGLRSETERYAEHHPGLQALTAHILWGKSDGIVTDESYAPDRHDTEASQTHTSVCKPTPQYQRPLTFVQKGLT